MIARHRPAWSYRRLNRHTHKESSCYGQQIATRCGTAKLCFVRAIWTIHVRVHIVFSFFLSRGFEDSVFSLREFQTEFVGVIIPLCVCVCVSMLFLKKIVVSTDGDQSREASDNITRKKNKLFRCIMLTHLRFVHANVGTCAIKNDERGNYFFFSLTVVCVTPINVTSTNRVSLSLLMGISAYGIGSPALCRRGGKDLCITSFITSHVYNMYIGRKWVYLFLFILLGIFLSSLWIKTNLLWRSEGGIYNNNVLIKLGECYGFVFSNSG